MYGFVGNDGANKLDKFGLDGYFKVTEETVEGSDPNVPDSVRYERSEQGFKVEYFKDESETCEYEKIKIVQVISSSGEINKAPKVDVGFPNLGPGYNEGSKYPETNSIITDAPGAGETDKEATYYIEDCAYCCLGEFPGERLLGCTRFNFDNKLRTVEPRQDNAKKMGLGEFEIPAYKPETRLFWAGWDKWKKTREPKAS